ASRYRAPERLSGTVSRVCLPPPLVGSIPALVGCFSAPCGFCTLLRVGFALPLGFFHFSLVEVAASTF
ncbi:hypothetical protein FCV25MIE_08120, partial [Fagus crenata]